MTLQFDEETMLQDTARGWVNDKSPVAVFRRLRDAGSEIGYDPAVWADIAAMGWAGCITPEAYGGSGIGYRAVGLILEEMGRALVASPLLASAVAAASALVAGGSEAQKREWLPRLATGSRIATLAIDETAHHQPGRIALRAEAAEGGYVLSGRKCFVLEGASADLLIVAARTSGEPQDQDGISLFLVPAGTPGVTRCNLKLVDARSASNIDFVNCRLGADAVLGTIGDGRALLEYVLDRGRAALCAEMLGMAAEAFSMTLNYLKTRVQFGQLIGSFQALQHRAAIMFGEIELSRSAVEAALIAIDEDSPEVPKLVSLAKARMGDTLHLVTNEMMQMHGGIGMTDAFDAGFYLKRARATEAIFGNQAFHRDRYARIRGI